MKVTCTQGQKVLLLNTPESILEGAPTVTTLKDAPAAKLSYADGEFARVVVDSTLAESSETMAEVMRVLQAEGYVHVVSQGGEVGKKLLFAGFVGATSVVTAQKPKHDVGAAQPLKFAKKAKTNGVKKAWKISPDEDLVNEDDLLDEDDLKKPVREACDVPSDQPRKACKNCSCGLAEQEASAEAAAAPVKSACGNCYLGDAFRCASCPYRGTAPFEKGEKVKLQSNYLEDDI